MPGRSSSWTRWTLGLTFAASVFTVSESLLPAPAAQTLRAAPGEHGYLTVMPGLGGATASVAAGSGDDPGSADKTFTLAGTGYELAGDGMGCSTSGPAPTAEGVLSGLLFALFLLGCRHLARHID